MISSQKSIYLLAEKRGFFDVTSQVSSQMSSLHSCKSGILHLFIKHTSASLAITENTDPSVALDLESHFNIFVPEDAPYYTHTYEGKDDMPAHIKSALTNSQISLSIKNGELLIGTWQGLYLFEHRLNPQKRTIIHHFLGEP